MYQLLVSHWLDLMQVLAYGALILAAVALGLTHNNTGPVMDTTLDPDSLRLNRRRLKGGNFFNDLLWESKGEEERRMRKFLQRMADPDTADGDRQLYAAEVATSQRQLDRIYQMLTMKDPDHE